jgi:hypothetical protein
MKVATRRSIDVDSDEMILEALEVRHGRVLFPKRECNLDMLAESEIECFKTTIVEYGNKSFGELSDITHDSAWNATDENQPILLEFIVATLPNASEVSGYMHTD